MKSSVQKRDKFASMMLAAFLLIGSTHFACRYDLSAAIESFFQKASAETVIPQAQAANQEPLAANTSSAAALLEQGSVIINSITRNPFLMPASAAPTILSANERITASNSRSTDVSTAPVRTAEPLLRGIVSKGDKRLAIIEYQGVSNYYSAGQMIGNYTVGSIDTRSVSLSNSTNPLELHLGGND